MSKEEIKVPGPEFGLNELVDHFTQDVIKKKALDRKYNPLRPSSAGACERELGYEYMEFKGHATYEKEQLASTVQRIFNLGHHIERHVLDEARDAFKMAPPGMEIRYKQQVFTMFRLHDGTIIEGSGDGVWITSEHRIAIDVKSVKDKYSSYHASSWGEFEENMLATGHVVKFGENALYITDLEKFLEVTKDPWFAKNLYQLNMYACNEFLRERGVNLAAILQYNKNDSRMREIRFTPSQKVFEQTEKKFQKVALEVDTKQSVEGLNRDYVLGSAKCGFCKFRKECYLENDALKDYFQTLPAKQWPKDVDRLPTGLQEEILPLFEEYQALQDAPDKLADIEERLAGALYNAKVFKVRFNQDQVYQVKKLKTGGVGGSPRMVLRRSKV